MDVPIFLPSDSGSIKNGAFFDTCFVINQLFKSRFGRPKWELAKPRLIISSFSAAAEVLRLGCCERGFGVVLRWSIIHYRENDSYKESSP